MRDEKWLLDSGASEHIGGDARGFAEYNETPGKFMQADNSTRDVKDSQREAGAEAETTCKGAVKTVILQNVAFVPMLNTT